MAEADSKMSLKIMQLILKGKVALKSGICPVHVKRAGIITFKWKLACLILCP